MDRLPTELVLEVVEAAARLERPEFDKNTAVLLGAVLRLLKALRLTCKLYANNANIKDRIFHKITLFIHPKWLRRIRSTDFSSIKSHVQELRICSQSFATFPNRNYYNQYLSEGAYYHLLRLQSIWEHTKEHGINFPENFASANDFFLKNVQCKFPWTFKQVRAGYRAFSEYERRVNIDLSHKPHKRDLEKFVGQFTNLRHVNFTSGLDLHIHPIKSLPSDILLSEKWLDEIPQDLPHWCHRSILRFLNITPHMFLVECIAKCLSANKMVLDELTVSCYMGDAHTRWSSGPVKDMVRGRLRKLNYSPLMWPGGHTPQLGEVFFYTIINTARDTLQTIDLKPRYCPADDVLWYHRFGLVARKISFAGLPALRHLALRDVRIESSGRAFYCEGFWSGMPSLESIRGQQLRWQDIDGDRKPWDIMKSCLGKVDCSSVDYPDE